MFTFLEGELVTYLASFLFVFALVYALLAYSRLFPSTEKAYTILALVIAFFTITYSPFIIYMKELLPLATMLLVILFFIALIKRVFMDKAEGAFKDSLPSAVALAVLLLVVGSAWGNFLPSLPGITTENLLWIVGIFIIVGLFIVVYSHPEK